MKTFKSFLTSILLLGSILLYDSCEPPFDDEPRQYDPRIYPNINIGSDTITLPTSSITLTGTIDQNMNSYQIRHTIWECWSSPPGVVVTIDSPYSLTTKIEGLTEPGLYGFTLRDQVKINTIYGSYYVSGSCFVTVEPEYPSTFKIGSTAYRVQSVKRENNRIIVSSFRNGVDSASLTFVFFDSASIPIYDSSAYSNGDSYYVRADPTSRYEVSVSAVQTRGSNGIVYNGEGNYRYYNGAPLSDLSVSIKSDGKISIGMAEINGKQLLEQNIVKLSARIKEP